MCLRLIGMILQVEKLKPRAAMGFSEACAAKQLSHAEAATEASKTQRCCVIN